MAAEISEIPEVITRQLESLDIYLEAGRAHQALKISIAKVANLMYICIFDEHFQKLAEQPLRHPPVDDLRPGYRRSVCGKDSVYYRIVDDSVEITAILGSQDTKRWL